MTPSARVQHATRRLAAGERLWPEEPKTLSGIRRDYAVAAEVARIQDSSPPVIDQAAEQLITVRPSAAGERP